MARTESQVNLLLFDRSILSILINTYHYSTNHIHITIVYQEAY